jgi:hypothetical protein
MSATLRRGLSPPYLLERAAELPPALQLSFSDAAHVIKNDDRDAAEQAAWFLIGDDWPQDPETKRGTSGMKTAPGEKSPRATSL